MAMLTLKEAGKRLGFAYITLWTWVKANKIPHYVINGSYRIDEKDLEKFLRERKVKRGREKDAKRSS